MISDPGRAESAGGLVVAASQLAADAGAAALATGGTAVDAAVAAAFALCVVDPANCGVGGYGGFLTYLPPAGEAIQVDFNTWVPERLDPASFRAPGDVSQSLDSGAAVAPPGVVPGLVAAHARFGRLPLGEVVAPAIDLARDGFPVGHDLGRALAEQREKRGIGSAPFAAVFFPGGRLLREGDPLVQADLARTLEAIATDGAAPFRSGSIVEAICAEVRAVDGFLEPADFERDAVTIGPAETVGFEAAVVAGAPTSTSGAGVLFAALAAIRPGSLGGNRSRAYVDELARALLQAWDARTEATRLALQSPHTTTLCTADGEGGLVSLTFTHGPWFGSRVVAEGTGILLNAGSNLFASTSAGPRAVTNMCPIVIRDDAGAYAIGGTGGPRIPGLLLTAAVDVVHYGLDLGDALAAPHLSVRAIERELEVEPPLLPVAGRGRSLGLRDYGPTCGIARVAGRPVAAVDPRFGSGVAGG